MQRQSELSTEVIFIEEISTGDCTKVVLEVYVWA